MSGADREPAFQWNGRPVFRCRVCGPRYERVENVAAVLKHEAEMHAPVVTLRQSAIVGPDERPIEVQEIAGGEKE